MKKKPRPKPAKQSSGMSTILWFMAVAVALIGVFWIPWHVPYTAPAEGESYALGFNNKAGILALGFSIMLGVAACWFGKRPDSYKWLEAEPQLFPPWEEARIEYALLISVSTFMGAFILFWSSYLADPAWCEARGFMYGMDLLALGQVPYRDFMYNYGPATIYLPFWLSNILHGLSFEQAYAFILVLFRTCGFVALFVFLRSLQLPKSIRPWIMALLMVFWITESMGLQYAPLRSLIVPLSLILLHAVVSRQAASGIAPLIRMALAATISVGLCLAVSPEMGIAATVSVAAYSFILLLRRAIAGAAACLLGAILTFALTLVAFPGYLDSVFAFGSGGGNFPIFPNLHNLCMVALALILLPRLIASALANPAETRAPLAIALAVGGGMLLPAAFGRCDPGHVGFNGMIPLFMMFPAAAAAGKIAFRSWLVIYSILWAIFIQYSYWSQYIGNFTSAAKIHDYYKDHPEMVAASKAKWDALLQANPHGKDLHWSKVLPFPEGLQQLTSKGRVLLTSGNEGNLFLARFLLLQNPPPREYFHAYSQGASTTAQIETKVQQDRAYRFLIIPQSAVALIGRTIDLAAYSQGTDNFLSGLLLFPVTSEAKNPPYLPDTQFAARILNYYKILGQYSPYLILEQNSPAP